MAVDSATKPGRDGPQLLAPARARAAAIASIMASLAAIVALAAAIMGPVGNSPVIAATALIWVVMFVASIAVAQRLMAGRQWAQQALLAFWELLAMASVCVLLGGAMYGGEQGLVPAGAAGWLAVLIVVAALAVAAVMSGLLIAASRPGSRLRYGSVVTTSVAVAIAVALAVNIVAQHDYVRTSVESYGMYRLSNRTRRVIDGLDQPVKLTCVYAADESGAYGKRTFELLEEMADYAARRGKRLQAASADTESEKRDVLAELTDKISAGAGHHIDYLRSFVADSPALVAEMRAQAGVWSDLPAGAYVNQWPVAEDARRLSAYADRLEALRSRLAGQVGSPGLGGLIAAGAEVPDYAALARETTASLAAARNKIADIAYDLQAIQAVAASAEANRPGVVDGIDRLAATCRAMTQAVGAPGEAAPADPRALLGEFVERAGLTVQGAQGVAILLSELAGRENCNRLKTSAAWWVEFRDGQGSVARMWPDALMVTLAPQLGALAQGVDDALEPGKFTDEYLAGQVAPLRQDATRFSQAFADASEQALAAVDRIANVDETSLRMMADANSGALMRGLLTGLDDLLDRAGRLPPLADETLPDDLKRDNIIIVEIGDDTEVIPFEAIWSASGGAGPADENQRRLFNGNDAISAKLLSMTTGPVATVIVAHYRPAGDVPRAQIEFTQLTTLYKLLAESNIEVLFWNVVSPVSQLLARDDADQATYAGRPVALLVLPPRPQGIAPAGQPAPTFEPRHMAKIKQVIDSGTPAVFLASYLWPTPGQAPAELNAYLRREWGIDVRDNYMVIPTIPDRTEPGRFMLNYRWMGHLPLDLFADHPIGAPITGQRTLWCLCCPVEISSDRPAGVAIEPVLAIPAAWGDRTWATPHVRNVLAQADRGLVSPDYDRAEPDLPDLRIPNDEVGMPLALAAARQARPASDDPARPAEGAKPVRIVVLGVGTSFVDGYIDSPPRADVDEPKGAGDPPRANAELVINSVLWTIGREALIAAGPPRAQPIKALSPASLAVLQLLCVVVLPAVIVAAGGVVMLVRRR